MSLTKGTVSFWFKKFGAVAVEGETMLSWAPDVGGTGRYCSPRHPSHFEPSSLELNDISSWRAISAGPYPEDWLDKSKEKKSTFQSVKLMHTGRLQFSSAEPTGTTQINLETFETGQDSGEQKICYAESVAMPELFNGMWHHFAVVIEAGGVLRTTTRRTLCSHEPSPRVCMRNHPEGKSCVHVRSRFECLF